MLNLDQLLCYVNSVSEQHRGTAVIFLYYSLSSFSTFSFYVFFILKVLIHFLGASIVCVNNLRGQHIVCDSLTGRLSVHTLGNTAIK